ncbi:hypothetical protein ACB092_02G001600 [Castanea dentata]
MDELMINIKREEGGLRSFFVVLLFRLQPTMPIMELSSAPLLYFIVPDLIFH